MKLILWISLILIHDSMAGAFRFGPFPDEYILPLKDELADIFRLPTLKQLDSIKFRQLMTEIGVVNGTSDIAASKKILEEVSDLCSFCQTLTKFPNLLRFFIEYVAQWTCTVLPGLSEVCNGLISNNLPVLKYLFQTTGIHGDLVCSIVSEKCESDQPLLNWTINITSNSTRKIPKKVSHEDEAKPLKIIHLSDVHISTDYKIGGEAECSNPIICCKGDPDSHYKGRKAGAWGDYGKCDSPMELFMDVLKHINSTEKDIDMIYFTGDIIDHTIWESHNEDDTDLIKNVYQSLNETFPNIKVMPVLGNHDAGPVNIYAPSSIQQNNSELSQEPLYELVAGLWKSWLNETSLSTVKRQGYYAHTFNNKLKIIALNNNVCYHFNWWLLYDIHFIEEQLYFLRKELEDSEAREQFVHIIAHQPTGNGDCVRPWERSYVELVRRFAHIIKGQFYGHTHTDELKIFYDEKGDAINVGYNGASLTTYQNYNPNYKVMLLDRNNYDILDINTYTMNLTLANQHSEESPKWYLLYSMKNAYNLNSFAPKDLDGVVQGFFKNDTLLDMYWRYSVREADASLEIGCDDECRKQLRCRAITTDSSSPQKQCK